LPSILSVRYRNELAEVIRAIVRDGLPTDEASIFVGIPNSVSLEDKQKFVMLIQNELKSMHAGNAIRFGLRLLEFSVRRQKHQADCAE